MRSALSIGPRRLLAQPRTASATVSGTSATGGRRNAASRMHPSPRNLVSGLRRWSQLAPGRKYPVVADIQSATVVSPRLYMVRTVIGRAPRIRNTTV